MLTDTIAPKYMKRAEEVIRASWKVIPRASDASKMAVINLCSPPAGGYEHTNGSGESA